MRSSPVDVDLWASSQGQFHDIRAEYLRSASAWKICMWSLVKMMGVNERPCFLPLIEKTKLTFVRQLEAGDLLSRDFDSLSGHREWRRIWKGQGRHQGEGGI